MVDDSLWIISADDNQSSKPILDFVIDQGDKLKKETNGRIKGVLTRAGTPLNSMIEVISKLNLTVHYQPTYHEGLKDAANLYVKNTYEFIIVDDIHKYELSVFQITCNDSLPIKLSIDPTIAKEEKLEESMDINNLETFKSIFRDMVTSHKVVYIISRLLKLPNPASPTSEDQGSQELNRPK